MTNEQLDKYNDLMEEDPEWATFLMECAKLAGQAKSVILSGLLRDLSKGLTYQKSSVDLVSIPVNVEFQDTTGKVLAGGADNEKVQLMPDGSYMFAFGIPTAQVLANIAVSKKVLVYMTFPKNGNPHYIQLKSISPSHDQENI